MRFKTDENIHPEVASLLAQAGHDVLTVWDQQMRGALDTELAEACRREHRVLITLDLDFADIRMFPPQLLAGLMVLRLQTQSRTALVEVIRRTVPLLHEIPIQGRLWIVDEGSVRVLEATA